MDQPRPNRAERRDKNRLRRWYDTVQKARVSRAAKGYCLHLGKRSDPTAKHVWGGQTKLADELDCSVRQVQRYQLECERAGLIDVKRGPIVRETDGTVHRAWTNRYLFCVPPGKPRRAKPSSHRYDTSVAQGNNILTDIDTTFRASTVEQCRMCVSGWIERPGGEFERCKCVRDGLAGRVLALR